jgi:PAS domain S-box-containing protein
MISVARRASWWRPLTVYVGLILVAVGMIITLRTTTGIDLKIDQVLFADRLNGNRVAPNTAFNFFLIGAALLTYAYKQGMRRLILGLILANAFISILSIIGYSFGLKELFGYANFNPMALHAAVSFLLVDALIAMVFLGMREVYANKRVMASLLLAVLIPVLATIVAERSLHQSVMTQDMAGKTEAIITSTETLRIAMLDAETGQRGYLLTGRETYLEPYSRAQSVSATELGKLANWLDNDPETRQHVATLQTNIDNKFGELAQTIELKRQGRNAQALQIVNSDQGKRYLDDVRGDLDTIKRARSDALAALRTDLKGSQVRTKWFMALSIAVDLILLAGAFLLMQRLAKEQTESYAALDAEKYKLQTLLESIGDGVFVIDHKKNIVLFNEAAAEISGFTSEQALGKKYDEILKYSYEADGSTNNDFIKAALGGSVAEMANHTQLQRRDGRMVPVADSAAPFFHPHHKSVEGVIVVFRDVTRERRLEQAKDDFVSLASHQLRTPATAVKQFLGLILEGYAGNISKLSEQQTDLIQQAYDSNDEQIELVNSLLEIARIEAGTAEFIPAKTKIGALIGKVVARQKALVGAKGQELRYTAPEPELEAIIDANLIMTCLDNLIGNASKYTPEKSHIDVVVHATKKLLTISVSDNGPGISPEGQAQLFQRFSRLDHSTNGTGLGLYLIKLVCEMHGGTAKVHSIPGKGSTFSILIPTGEQDAQKNSHSRR